MDPITLAAGAVALLGPYVAKAAGEFAGEAGKAAWALAGRLLGALRGAAADKPAERAVLEDFERDPAQAAAAARDAVARLVELEPALAGEVDGILREAKRLGPQVRVVQRITEAEDVVGLRARRVGGEATVEVDQQVGRARTVLGADLGDIG